MNAALTQLDTLVSSPLPPSLSHSSAPRKCSPILNIRPSNCASRGYMRNCLTNRLRNRVTRYTNFESLLPTGMRNP